jgi:clan AA aspartic protease
MVIKEACMQLKNENQMGKVFTNLTIINNADQIRAEDGTISADQIRSVTLQNVLVDTGATTLFLPADIISKLGLRILKEVDVVTAMGIGTTRVFKDATISIYGREGTFECLELPGGKNPLLGVIPLEALGLEPDLKNQQLKVLPISPTETYLTI